MELATVVSSIGLKAIEEIYALGAHTTHNSVLESWSSSGTKGQVISFTGCKNNYFLNEQSCELEEYDEQLVRRLIEKVTVHDDNLEVEFKSGICIEIEN